MQGAPRECLAPARFRKVKTSRKCNPSNQSHLSAENQAVPLRALSSLFSCWMKYLSISRIRSTALQAILLCFLLPGFIFFLTKMRKGWSWGCCYAILSWPASVGCCCILHDWFLHFLLLLFLLTSTSPPVIPHCFSADLFIELFVYYFCTTLPSCNRSICTAWSF